jgi:hypothetical protein
MKRTKRLSIEIQHREVMIAVSSLIGDLQEPGRHDMESKAGDLPGICSVCGSPWIPVVVHGGDEVPAGAHNVHRALERAGMHLHVSATGQLNICRKSLENIKENL